VKPGEERPTEFAAVEDGERTMIRTSRGRLPTPVPREGWVHYLVYNDDRGEAQRLRLEPRVPVRIGRRAPCELVLRDSEVSGVHCEVVLQADELMVSDRGSTNGTFVDGKRVFAHEPVPHGGLLQVGRQVLKHEFRDQAELAQSQELDRDLSRASHYVQSLLPQPLRDGPVRVDWWYQPSAQVGGDGFGYHALDEHRLVLYLVDVSGHGVGAAMHGVSVLGALRQQTLPDTNFADPAQVLTRLNAMFQMDRHAGMFFTIWYGVYDDRSGCLDYASAGHHPAYLWHPNDGTLQPLQTRNLVIGAMPDIVFRAGRAQLAAGQRLYVFSDGVFEIVTRNGQDWGLPDFLRLLGQPVAAGSTESEQLFRAVQATARPGPLDDDFSLMVAHIG
jgi:serine phosphatase RsbU (regulator of sigma subunit)